MTMTSENKTLDTLVTAAIAKIEGGTLTISDLLKALAPNPAEVKPPASAPMAVSITNEQRRAIERVVEVFGKVVPTERRALQPAEVSALVEEKEVLAEVKKMAETRQDSIRTTIFNHLDVEAEAIEGFDPETLRDVRGHYAIDGEARGTDGTGSKFTRETRQSAPSLDTAALKTLSEDDSFEGFTHADYLSMTTQVRVVDENKIMLALKKNPSLVHAVAEATKPGAKSTALNLRKA